MKRYRIDNWTQHNRSLIQRGSITIWVEDGSIEAWMAERKKGQRESPKRKGPVDVVFDSTGLKVYGEGEWKVRKHGAGKRRTWKKPHIRIDPSSQQIMVAELTDRDGGDASVAEEILDKIRTPLGRVYGKIRVAEGPVGRGSFLKGGCG